MKRFVSFILCLLFAISFSISVNAIEVQSEPSTREAILHPISEQFITPRAPAISIQQLGAGQYHFFAEGSVYPGTTYIHIEDLTWYPANTIEIGYRNLDTLIDYIVTFSGGSVDNTNILTSNLPAGSYGVYIKNTGKMAISGTMYYNWIE